MLQQSQFAVGEGERSVKDCFATYMSLILVIM